jgi:hypothetical protein
MESCWVPLWAEPLDIGKTLAVVALAPGLAGRRHARTMAEARDTPGVRIGSSIPSSQHQTDLEGNRTAGISRENAGERPRKSMILRGPSPRGCAIIAL